LGKLSFGVKANKLISNELQKAEVARQILGNAHSEDVELRAARIQEAMASCGEMRLLELQRRSRLPLVDVWLLGAAAVFGCC
jgi:hypothetical protein